MLAVSADFEARHDDIELTFALNLAFKPVKQDAFKLHDLAATQARHVNVIALRSSLVKVFFALKMHEIKLVYKAVALE